MVAHGRNSNGIPRSSDQFQFQPYPIPSAPPFYADLPSSTFRPNLDLAQDFCWSAATNGSEQAPFHTPPSTEDPSPPAAQDLTARMFSIPDQITSYPTSQAPLPSTALGGVPELWPVDSPSLDSSGTIESEPARDATVNVPSQPQLDELCSIYFHRYYPILPIFSEERLATSLQKATTTQTTSDSPLLYAFVALVAGNHPSTSVKSQQQAWFKKAKHLYEQTAHIPHDPLHTLQAAACIVLHALVVGDFSAAWLVMGKAWRQIVALGLNQMDSPSTKQNGSTAGWRELEERRRTVWSLFILDRGICFPMGLAHTIDERQLRVNLPMGENTAQSTGPPPEHVASVLFTPNLRKLLSLVGGASQQTSPNVFHYLIISYLLLGRIVEHMYRPEADGDDEDDAEQDKSMLESLQQDVSHMRLMMPRAATDIASAAHPNCIYVVWMNAIMNVNTIFLFHRTPRRPEQPQGCKDDIENSDGSAASNWQICVAVAKKTAQLIREASLVSTDLLVNPNISAPVYTCARILAIEHLLCSSPLESEGRAPQSTGLLADLQVFLLLFDRLSEAFTGVGAKFRYRVLDLLEQGPEHAREMKAAGSKTLRDNCLQWQAAVLASTPD
jgi:transcription factor-like protein